jgi:hypothetical protein
MTRCKFFIPVEPQDRMNCVNCKRWTGKKCRDEEMIKKHYIESAEFDYYDRLMRSNKPVVLD